MCWFLSGGGFLVAATEQGSQVLNWRVGTSLCPLTALPRGVTVAIRHTAASEEDAEEQAEAWLSCALGPMALMGSKKGCSHWRNFVLLSFEKGSLCYIYKSGEWRSYSSSVVLSLWSLGLCWRRKDSHLLPEKAASGVILGAEKQGHSSHFPREVASGRARVLLGEFSGSEFGHFASILWSGLDLRSDRFLQNTPWLLESGRSQDAFRTPPCTGAQWSAVYRMLTPCILIS